SSANCTAAQSSRNSPASSGFSFATFSTFGGLPCRNCSDSWASKCARRSSRAVAVSFTAGEGISWLFPDRFAARPVDVAPWKRVLLHQGCLEFLFLLGQGGFAVQECFQGFWRTRARHQGGGVGLEAGAINEAVARDPGRAVASPEQAAADGADGVGIVALSDE